MNDKLSLGDRMKGYEREQNSVSWDGSKPVICRLDGSAFHTLTNGLERPFDRRMTHSMRQTARRLADEFNPVFVYTQSDEITMCFYAPAELSQLPFGGKQFKLTSVLASACTRHFRKSTSIDRLKEAEFDCRCFEVPTKSEAVNCLYWRFLDCTRNSILSVGQHNFSHKELQGISCNEIVDMLKGVDPWEEYGPGERFGGFLTKNNEYMLFSVDMKGANHDELIELFFGKDEETVDN